MSHSDQSNIGWTQPVCNVCHFAYMLGADPGADQVRAPVRVVDHEVGAPLSERCVICERPTEGIYLRINPAVTRGLLESRRS